MGKKQPSDVREATELVAGIRAAQQAWNAPQDTLYFAEKFSYTPKYMLDLLQRLAEAGRITRIKRNGCYGADHWSVPG